MKKISIILSIALLSFVFLFNISFAYDVDGGGVPILTTPSEYWECVNSGGGSLCDTGWQVYNEGEALPLPPSEGGGSSCNLSGVDFKGAVSCIISDVINPLMLLIVGVAVLIFMYGGIKYIQGSTKPEERAQAKMFMIYGILGIFIMVSFWGFVNLLMAVFFGGAVTAPPYPSISAVDEIIATIL